MLQLVDLLLSIAFVPKQSAALHRIDELFCLELGAVEDGDDRCPKLPFSSDVAGRRGPSKASCEPAGKLAEVDVFRIHEFGVRPWTMGCKAASSRGRSRGVHPEIMNGIVTLVALGAARPTG